MRKDQKKDHEIIAGKVTVGLEKNALDFFEKERYHSPAGDKGRKEFLDAVSSILSTYHQYCKENGKGQEDRKNEE